MTRTAAAALRTRWPRRLLYALAVLLFVGLVAADRAGWLLAKNVDDLGVYHGRAAAVSNVLSGDVIEITVVDKLHERPTTQVKLWGIRAPQPPRPGRDGAALWEESLAHATTLVLGSEVVLSLESLRTRDPQGRLLAHIEIPTGGTLNEAMLMEGLAMRDEQWPHAMLTAYAQAENRARRRGKGIWAR